LISLSRSTQHLSTRFLTDRLCPAGPNIKPTVARRLYWERICIPSAPPMFDQISTCACGIPGVYMIDCHFSLCDFLSSRSDLEMTLHNLRCGFDGSRFCYLTLMSRFVMVLTTSTSYAEPAGRLHPSHTYLSNSLFDTLCVYSRPSSFCSPPRSDGEHYELLIPLRLIDGISRPLKHLCTVQHLHSGASFNADRKAKQSRCIYNQP